MKLGFVGYLYFMTITHYSPYYWSSLTKNVGYVIFLSNKSWLFNKVYSMSGASLLQTCQLVAESLDWNQKIILPGANPLHVTLLNDTFRRKNHSPTFYHGLQYHLFDGKLKCFVVFIRFHVIVIFDHQRILWTKSRRNPGVFMQRL